MKRRTADDTKTAPHRFGSCFRSVGEAILNLYLPATAVEYRASAENTAYGTVRLQHPDEKKRGIHPAGIGEGRVVRLRRDRLRPLPTSATHGRPSFSMLSFVTCFTWDMTSPTYGILPILMIRSSAVPTRRGRTIAPLPTAMSPPSTRTWMRWGCFAPPWNPLQQNISRR